MFPILLLAVALIIVLARILTRWMGADAPANDPERKRILAMVESGKITSQEGAELLDAIGKSSALRAQDAFSRPDIVLLVGVGLVVLGFFLPWVRVRFDALVGIFGWSTACQYGYHVGAVGWAVLIMAIASAIPIFITPSRYLYKISMLQVFLAILGLMIVASLLISAGDKLQAGLVLCALGFAVEIAAAAAKFRQLGR